MSRGSLPLSRSHQAQQLDAVDDPANGAGVVQHLEINGLRGINLAALDKALQLAQIQRLHHQRVAEGTRSG